MAIKKNPPAAAAAPVESIDEQDLPELELSEGFVDISVGQERYVWDKKVVGARLRGFPASRFSKPSTTAFNKFAEAYVIVTTAPCQGLNRNKEVVDVPVGGRVFVWRSAATSSLDKYVAGDDATEIEIVNGEKRLINNPGSPPKHYIDLRIGKGKVLGSKAELAPWASDDRFFDDKLLSIGGGDELDETKAETASVQQLGN